MDVGEDTGTPVMMDYNDKMPYRYNGKLERVVIDLLPVPGSNVSEVNRAKREGAKAVAASN
jgi:hypothetical protein